MDSVTTPITFYTLSQMTASPLYSGSRRDSRDHVLIPFRPKLRHPLPATRSGLGARLVGGARDVVPREVGGGARGGAAAAKEQEDDGTD